jgi:hypothetical protein
VARAKTARLGCRMLQSATQDLGLARLNNLPWSWFQPYTRISESETSNVESRGILVRRVP